MDVVIQFAVHKLGFQLSDIIVYAWSIGGFTGKQSHTSKPAYHWSENTDPPQQKKIIHLFSFLMCCSILASWAVMSYPEIRALVLDASFDDLLPLALKVMPDSWSECFILFISTRFSKERPKKWMNECVCFHSTGPLVTHTVRQYMNLNNAEQLCKLVTFIMIYLKG